MPDPKLITPEEAVKEISAIKGNPKNIERLVEQIQTPLGIIPFVGAGLSSPFGFPMWGEFLKKCVEDESPARKVETKNLLKAGKYEDAADAVFKFIEYRAFHDKIDEEFNDKKLDDTVKDTAAHVLPRLANGPVFTLNFDRVLEKLFEQTGKTFDERIWGAKVDHLHGALQQDKRYLIKLHGDWKDRTDRILLKNEYDKHYGVGKVDLNKPLPALIKQAFTGRSFLFLGCSLGPDRIWEILLSTVGENIHYAILEQPKKKDAWHAKRDFLSKLGIRPIWYPAGRHDLVKPLLEYLAGLASVKSATPSPVKSAARILGANRRIEDKDDSLLLPLRGRFLGRGAEAKKIVAFLKEGSGGAVVVASQAVNINGAAGMGKTELCKKAIKDYMGEEPARPVFYVELAEAGNIAGFLQNLGTAFGVTTVVEEEVLNAALDSKGVLYLDNFEDVAGDGAAIAFLQKLQRLPGVSILVSSREQLPGMARNFPIDKLDDESAIELFKEEWGKSGADATLLDDEKLKEFVCNKLGGHPLSIVLVAAHGFEMTFTDVCAAWEEDWERVARLPEGDQRLTSLDVSITGSLKAVMRDKKTAIDALLLWGLFSMFPDGMPQTAWLWCMKENSGENKRASTLKNARGLLARLNLITIQDDGSAVMLPALRQFILAKAENNEVGISKDEIANLAFGCFLHIAEEARKHSFDEKHQSTLDYLFSQFGNIHYFILFAAKLDGGWPKKLSALSFNLLNFYQFRILSGKEILSELIKIQTAPELQLNLANSNGVAGDLEGQSGNFDAARKYYERAKELYEKEHNNIGIANTLLGLGQLERHAGNLEVARGHLEMAKGLYEDKVHNNIGIANTLESLGELELGVGNLEAARRHYESAKVLLKKLGNDLGLANTLRGLGDLEFVGGKAQMAKEHYLTTRELYLNERDPSGLAASCIGLAKVFMKEGDKEAVMRYIEEAEQAAKVSQSPLVIKTVAGVKKRLGL